MKLKKSLLLAPVALLLLASCSNIAKRYNPEDYVIPYKLQVDNSRNFNILQLSDLHMSLLDDTQYHYSFIQKTIDTTKSILANEKIDLIVITGDLFTFAGKSTVYELCDFFEKQKIPWTCTFGNHDEQGYFSVDWMTNYLSNLSKQPSSYLHFVDYPDDDVFGYANFVIDLGSTNQSVGRQIVLLDSNRYNYGEGFGYDYIHYDQIDWYNRMHQHFIKTYGQTNSLAFYHIPVPEFRDAYNDAKKGLTNATYLKGNQYDVQSDGTIKQSQVNRNRDEDKSDGSPKSKNTGFYEFARKSGYTKGMFVGHAHTNTYCVDYRPSNSSPNENSIGLCYGAKSTDRVYSNPDMLGGQLIRYHASPNGVDRFGSNWFDVDLIYHKYADLKEAR